MLYKWCGNKGILYGFSTKKKLALPSLKTLFHLLLRVENWGGLHITFNPYFKMFIIYT